MANPIVIVGAGLMGYWHARYARSLGAKVTGVVDSDAANAAKLAAQFNCQWHSDLPSALGQGSTGAVHICTPTESHASLIEQALEAGVHVLVEKPLAVTLAETEKLIELASRKEVVLNPVHQFPYQSGFTQLIERRAELGTPVRASYLTCSAGGVGQSGAKRRQVLLEILPHAASLFSRLLEGKFSANTLKLVRLTDDYIELSGACDEMSLSVVISLAGRPTRNEFSFVGTTGSAILDLFHGFALFESGEVSRTNKILRPLQVGGKLLALSSTNLAKRAALSEPAYPGLRQLINRFYGAAWKGEPAPISKSEMVESARLIDNVRNTKAQRIHRPL